MTFQELLQTAWFIPLLAASATAFGGLCTFLGGILATTIQLKSARMNKNKEEKKEILFEYIKFLRKYHLSISELERGDYINLRNQIDLYLKEFEENVQFSIFIGKKWQKKGHCKFVEELKAQIIESNDQEIKNIQSNILTAFSNEIDIIANLI